MLDPFMFEPKDSVTCKSVEQLVNTYMDGLKKTQTVYDYKVDVHPALDRLVDDQYRFAWRPIKVDHVWYWLEPYWTKRRVEQNYVNVDVFIKPTQTVSYVQITARLG